MNKYNNPRLLNAVVSGTGMKHPIQPHVVVGDESNGFIRGDLMDANAIVDLVNSILHPKEEDSYNYNGHEYVDLGLPSGTKWAKMNVGASSETDAGLYFAWGETQGYADASTKTFSWSDYKWTEDEGSTMSKYNETDGLTHLELADDAASVNMGGDWHIPNIAQCVELLKETTNGYITGEGAYTQYVWNNEEFGMDPTSITAAVDSWSTAGWLFFKSGDTLSNAINNGEYLFIPLAGSYAGGKPDRGLSGVVWTSALVDKNYPSEATTINALFLPIAGKTTFNIESSLRYRGVSVRGVVGKMDEITDETTPGEGEGPIK